MDTKRLGASAIRCTGFYKHTAAATTITAMNPLERSLIEKAGYANGWENVRESTAARVVLFSARHKAATHVKAC